MKKSESFESLLPKVCPITGKKVITKERWYHKGDNYSIRVGIIDGKILTQKATGCPTTEDLMRYFDIYDEVTSSYDGVGGKFITLDDYKGILNPTTETRDYLINRITSQENLIGKIFYNVPLSVKASINLGKRLHLLPCRIEVGKNYNDSLKIAYEILGKEWEGEFHKKTSYRVNTCPYSGLQITDDDEFLEVKVDDYTVSVKLIGERIIYHSISGDVSNIDFEKNIKIRNRFIEKYVPNETKVIEIFDLANITSLPKEKARRNLSEISKRGNNKILEVILTHPSFFVRLAVKMFSKTPIKTFARKKLKDAILLAVKSIEKNENLKTEILFEKILLAKPEWRLDHGVFKCEWKILPGKILVFRCEGSAELDHIQSIVDTEKDILKEYFSDANVFYRIADYSNLQKASVEARRDYFNGFGKLYTKKPYVDSHLFIVGANNLITAAMKLKKYLWPGKMHFESNMDLAFKNVRKREKETEIENKRLLDQSKNVIHDKKVFKRSEVEKEVENLIATIGELSWGQTEYKRVDTKGSIDVFDPIYESLNVVESDINTVLEQKAQRERNIQLAENEIIKTRDEVLEKAHKRGMSHEANRAKSNFLANISHELRNPMHGIISYARFGEKKLKKVPKDRLKQYFRAILETSNDLLVLLDDLLDISKMESGKIEYNFETHDLNDLINYIIKRYHAKCMEKMISVQYLRPSFDVKLTLDNSKIRQVISNIVSNAINYSPQNGLITISVKQVEKHLVLSIADKGKGVPENEIKKIFEEFTQSSTSNDNEGTGLGLAISKQIIKTHKGDIWAENNPSGGAVFKIKLPINQIEEKKVA